MADGYAPFRAAFVSATGREPQFDAARFAEIVSPEYFIAVRTRFGGPAPAPLGAALAGYRAALADFRTRNRGNAEHDATTRTDLTRRFAALKEKP